VAGARNGYFPPARDAEVAAQVRASGADLLFVGMPSPRKERFLMDNRRQLQVPFAMGVGGSFDVLAGHVRRAPRALQRSGLEWAFRLAQEPRRLGGRYLSANSRFLMLLLRARLGRAATARVA
jgi:N-acetylglucosaminyldiphosphoundecaprenol N-acetyl-beta-D-mannosaminyltransferase